MKKLLFLILMCCLLNASSSLANSLGPIAFDRFQNERTYLLPLPGPKPPGAFGSAGRFLSRDLGMSLGKFKQSLKDSEDMGVIHPIDTLIKTPNKNYRMIVYAAGEAPASSSVLAYIFDNGVAVGYILLDGLQIYREDAAHVWYNQVTALTPVNVSGLSMPTGIELKTYQKIENGFIERYTFIHRPRMPFDGDYLPANITRTNELFMDAYYPEEIDEYLVQYFILGELQAYIDYLKNY